MARSAAQRVLNACRLALLLGASRVALASGVVQRRLGAQTLAVCDELSARAHVQAPAQAGCARRWREQRKRRAVRCRVYALHGERVHTTCSSSNQHARRSARRDVDAARWLHDKFEDCQVEQPEAAAPPEGDLREWLSGRAQPTTRPRRTSEPRSQRRLAGLSLAQFLDALNLARLLPLFEAEEVDMAALALCSDADLQSLGVPMGPRKKIWGGL